MTKEIVINDRSISDHHRPYVIAEISANHNGSLERALQTIKSAKEIGVDAVKIQTYTPDTMTIDAKSDDFVIREGLWKGRTLYQLYEEAHTPFEWHEHLFCHAKNLGITIFSSPFDESAVELLESLGAPAYKIASFELVDLPLIRYIAETGKPMLMSTGMASYQEIGEALENARTNGCNDLALFHCISGYPTPITQVNISAIVKLKKEFNVLVGLSDHTIGTLASVVATSVGANLIEKHFTLSREEAGVDSSFSIEPQEMKYLVEMVSDAFLALGQEDGIRSNAEEGNKIFRRSLYFVANLVAGETIQPNHIRRIRPGFGLPPKFFDDVVGRKVSRDIFEGEPVLEETLL